jgi:predicted CXXCH cytochrome family protein
MFRTLLFSALALLALPLAAATTSADCRACHDGQKALKMDNGHPVEIDYAKVRAAKPERFRAAPAEYLVDGRVECSSCHLAHDTQTDRKYRLRTDVITLCESCHIVE